jgi:copper chaperone
METMELTIGGMSCNHCVAALRKELGRVDGLEVDEVGVGTAKVRFDETRVDRRRIEEAVARAGYDLVRG